MPKERGGISMKKLLIGFSGFIFLVASFGLTFDEGNSNKMFMQKNFKEINSSTDYIDKSSSFIDPITLNPLNTPRVMKKNQTAAKRAVKTPNRKAKMKAQSLSKSAMKNNGLLKYKNLKNLKLGKRKKNKK